MFVNLNGKTHEIKLGLTLINLIEELGLAERKAIAIALNGEVLKREDYAGIVLSEGDSLEIVRAIGGGS
ncbi:MAG: sulfur carrier protein ThiS [SAR202 cluster bacterium]|jgi:sulfur carrier protein|nr:MAG: sulfur carrier protein ThiS [SAR202 cluster bacterium]KAA1306483.1 MAG: sulfur carrier protein ThiS [SAR202 cluster bacterium]MED5409073.1 sulfur carrier protein ThiS [Chloroflexota bacterium]MEE3346120.1 sulfur carrier protein ThiS [Chloroflexota bacterium]|tara:strand:- start:114 stop:320 length:207 start_codon:yes stop_codon:yes gene_type:complete